MERKKFNLWVLLRNVIIGAVVAAVISAMLTEAAPDIISPSCGENAMFAFLFIALAAGMYGLFAMLHLADDKGAPEGRPEVVAASLHIDQRITMAANAMRYEWLRDPERFIDGTRSWGDISVAAGDQIVFGQDLDKAVDIAMRLARPDEQYS